MRNTKVLLLLLAVLIVSSPVLAKEVRLDHNGLTLNGELVMGKDSSLSDGVILVLHGGFAHRDLETLVYLRSLLNATHGYNVLAINLGYEINDRHGMPDCKIVHRHRQQDSVAELDAWINWLKEQGADNITILGHSRGGAQAALYGSGQPNPLVRRLVLLAPSTRDNGGATYDERFQEPLKPVLDKARELVISGKGDTVLNDVNIMRCRDVSATAASFYSYYGQDDESDAPLLLEKTKLPVLVVVAGGDTVVPGLDSKIQSLVDGKRIQMKIIDGADHFFLDLFMDDAVEQMIPFLEE